MLSKRKPSLNLSQTSEKPEKKKKKKAVEANE